MVTPGPIIPARELLGDLLVELGRMAKEPNRLRGLYGAGRAAELAGDREKARKYYGQLVQQVGDAGTERPELRHAKSILGAR